MGVHEDGAPAHAKQLSMTHLAPQPSPSVLLPSSHASSASTLPSPQGVLKRCATMSVPITSRQTTRKLPGSPPATVALSRVSSGLVLTVTSPP
jgi:hypothetical protein